MHILNIKNVYFLDIRAEKSYGGPMKTGDDGKKSKEMNRGFNQLSELRRQIELGQLFHASNQPGEIPEGDSEPDDGSDYAIAFNGAVGFVVSRQRLRGILLMRSEKQIHHEIRCEEKWDRHIMRELSGHIDEFAGGCGCPTDPSLN